MSRPVAMITGASAGIGAEFGRRLAANGYDLVLVARRRERLDALVTKLQAAHPGLRAVALAFDLAAPESVGAIVAELARQNIAVDLLVNNAGFGAHGVFARQDAGNAAAQIAVNVNALVALTHAFVPAMVERRRGGVINLASTASFQPVPNMAVYGATKAFVLSFTEALHEELRDSGVRVVALCPGATATEFFGIAGERAALGPKRDVRDVVRTGLRAFDRNRAVAVDGILNAALAESIRFAPRGLVARIGGMMMGLRR